MCVGASRSVGALRSVRTSAHGVFGGAFRFMSVYVCVYSCSDEGISGLVLSPHLPHHASAAVASRTG